MAGPKRLASVRGRWRDSSWARYWFVVWVGVVVGVLVVGVGGEPHPTLPRVQYVGALLQVDNFTEYALEFRRALAASNQQPGSGIHLEGVSLPIGDNLAPRSELKSAANRLIYICDAVSHNNITTFVAIGGQDLMNTLSIVTSYVGLPIIGYNTDRQNMAIRVSHL